MALYSSQFGDLFGIGSARESYERTFGWGRKEQALILGVSISGAARDSGNTDSTAILRPGLVMGIIAATGLYTNYAATATDGSNVAAGVLPVSLRMTDLITGSNSQKVAGMVVGGPVQAGQLFGLDQQARAQMFGRFVFDDNLYGNRFPYQMVTPKTSAYQITAADNGTVFSNRGATGSVTFTLPATITNGFWCKVIVEAGYAVVVTAASGKMIAYNNAAATSVAYSTGSAEIGGSFEFFADDVLGAYFAVPNLATLPRL